VTPFLPIVSATRLFVQHEMIVANDARVAMDKVT
jgi:hypothetical protein